MEQLLQNLQVWFWSLKKAPAAIALQAAAVTIGYKEARIGGKERESSADKEAADE